MNTTGNNGTNGKTELKVTEDGELHGAAVTMDEGEQPAVAEARGEETTGEQAAGAVPDLPEAASPEHKKQLRERVEARRQELQGSLEQLQANAGVAPPEKVLAIETALQGLDTHLGGGWDCVGEVESFELARWLENTQFLGVVGQRDDVPATPAADQVAGTEEQIAAFDGNLGPVSGQPTAATPTPMP